MGHEKRDMEGSKGELFEERKRGANLRARRASEAV